MKFLYCRPTNTWGSVGRTVPKRGGFTLENSFNSWRRATPLDQATRTTTPRPRKRAPFLANFRTRVVSFRVCVPPPLRFSNARGNSPGEGGTRRVPSLKPASKHKLSFRGLGKSQKKWESQSHFLPRGDLDRIHTQIPYFSRS